MLRGAGMAPELRVVIGGWAVTISTHALCVLLAALAVLPPGPAEDRAHLTLSGLERLGHRHFQLGLMDRGHLGEQASGLHHLMPAQAAVGRPPHHHPPVAGGRVTTLALVERLVDDLASVVAAELA